MFERGGGQKGIDDRQGPALVLQVDHQNVVVVTGSTMRSGRSTTILISVIFTTWDSVLQVV
jgi:hypothetical protein